MRTIPPAARIPSKRSQLTSLAKAVRTHHRGFKDGLFQSAEHALQAGRSLLSAKKLCNHGEWLEWLEENCEVGEREAQRYMRFAKHYSQISNPTSMSDLPTMSRGLLAIAKAKSDEKPDDTESDDGTDADADEPEEEEEEQADDSEPNDAADDEDEAAEDNDADDGEDEDEPETSEDEDEQDNSEDLDSIVDRFVDRVEAATADLMPHIEDVMPLDSKTARRVLRDCRTLIQALLGTASKG